MSFGTHIKFLLGHIWLSISSKVIRGPSSLVLASKHVALCSYPPHPLFLPWVPDPPARQAKNPHPSFYRMKSTTFQPCWKILTRFIIPIRKIREPFLRKNRRRKPVLRTPTIPPLPWNIILFAWKFCERRIWQHSYKLPKRNLSWLS